MSISAIVLAAGTSSRMNGVNKLLLPLLKKTSLQVVVENIAAANVEEIIVVLGHEADKIRALLSHLPVNFVYNNDYKKGMTTSIQAGVSVAAGDGYMICLSDMPFVSPGDYWLLKSTFESRITIDRACICMPQFQGNRGNPVIFSFCHRDEILQHNDMLGCKGIVSSHSANVLNIELQTAGILKDIDTWECYEKLRRDSIIRSD